jgi:WD40 repeat protein
VAGHRSRPVIALAMAPDGRTLATSGEDETVRLWHVATGAELCTLDKPPGTIISLAFSPDGTALVGKLHNDPGIVWWSGADVGKGFSSTNTH